MAEKTALVFGGNGFMGSETVHRLLEDNYKITCVSRGNWYWDSDQRIQPRVKHIECDRKNPLTDCKDLIKHLETSKTFDVIIDFSGYKSFAVSNAIDLLRKRTKLYIFISSDSVYEVSVDKTHPGLIKEEDAVRPNSPELQAELNNRDSYGHRKLECEETIKEKLGSKTESASYVILRLPDVIGPRDTTNRWFPYQMWAQFYHRIRQPFIIPAHLQDLATSYVYVKDVADAVMRVINSEVRNEIFNVALDKPVTLKEFLVGLCDELEVKDFEFDVQFHQSAFSLFPSVTKGAIDNSKIKRLLEWTPTDWKDVYRETVEFYRTALVRFPTERQDSVETLLSNVVKSEDEDVFLDTLKAEMHLLTSQNQNLPPKKKRTEL